ncbi:MAG TPA: hypothetical protein PLK31_10860, partial [Chloroflexota bacterium]|nr:hypothetical protein [Chloroflexota bacterium]
MDALESLINNTAVPLFNAQLCGDDQPGDVPNNVFGHGRIDALNAYNNIPDPSVTLGLDKTGPATAVPGQWITYTLTLQNLHPISVTNNVVLTDVIPAETTFVAASAPHTFDGTTVQWDFASLAAEETVTVTLTVMVDMDTTATVIENNQYGSQSDEAQFVAGSPVQTTVIPFELGL